MNGLVKFMTSLAFGIGAGVITFFVYMPIADAIPLEWFGSCFEGACGYAAGLIGFAISLLVSIVVTIWLLVRNGNARDPGR